MKYLSLLLLSVLFIPLVQVAHAQNIVEEIGQAFSNLTSGMMGGNETSSSGNASSTGSGNETSSSGNASSTGSGNETSSSGNASSTGSGNETSSSGNASSTGSGNETSSSGNASSTGSGNETSSDVGSIQELQNLTSGNQEIFTNNTDLAGGNTSLGQGMEQEQYVEPENQTNALSSANSTQ